MGRWTSVGRACAMVGSLTASACVGDDLPVGLIEHELADGTVSIMEIESVRAWRYPTLNEHDACPTAVHAEVLARDADQQPIGLQMILQAGAWSWSGVIGCHASPFGGSLVCDRVPGDSEGNGYHDDHRIEREADGDGEIVRVWVRFADDGEGGPREARATFRFDPDDAELVEIIETLEP